MGDREQLSLTKNESLGYQVLWRDAPLKLSRLAFVARPATVNLLDAMLAHVPRQLRRRRQRVGPLRRWIVVNLRVCATFVEATTATGVTAGLTHVRQGQMT